LRIPPPGVAIACLVIVAAAAGPLAAQSDDSRVGASPFGHMHMLFERTIFNVDVLTLDVCLDSATAETVAVHARGGRTDDGDDAIAAAAIDAPAALGRIRFLRGVSKGQFLGGIRDEQEKAVRAGLLADSTFRMISDSLPVWFDFLDDRGIRDGDRIFYVFRDDSLRTVYHGEDGTVLLDRTDVGTQRRTSVLATWFAPRSDFRRPLLDSLDDGDPADPAACTVPPTDGATPDRASLVKPRT
jgi:hypothetical protein